ncbi:MAG: SAM-dependent methyltransferase [Tannerella sp.]|jgi:predicted O-methyltransferase YrrM|nr:SAM-dependent methyltransferase [Tannerella sp.]
MRIRLIYRSFFCRNGHGVHSPFVFALITKVIEERSPYYFYEGAAIAWLQLQQNEQPVHIQKGGTTVKKVAQKDCIPIKEGAFLFRLANYCHPLSLLTIGSSLGLIPFYLTGYASGLRCITLEREAELAAVADCLLKKEHAPVEIYTGSYEEQLPKALSALGQVDCLYLEKELDAGMLNRFFEQCLPFMKDETICIVGGIHASSAKRQCWQNLCKHPRITVSIDLCTMGLLFLQPKLHQRTYKAFIP